MSDSAVGREPSYWRAPLNYPLTTLVVGLVSVVGIGTLVLYSIKLGGDSRPWDKTIQFISQNRAEIIGGVIVGTTGVAIGLLSRNGSKKELERQTRRLAQQGRIMNELERELQDYTTNLQELRRLQRALELKDQDPAEQRANRAMQAARVANRRKKEMREYGDRQAELAQNSLAQLTETQSRMHAQQQVIEGLEARIERLTPTIEEQDQELIKLKQQLREAEGHVAARQVELEKELQKEKELTAHLRDRAEYIIGIRVTGELEAEKARRHEEISREKYELGALRDEIRAMRSELLQLQEARDSIEAAAEERAQKLRELTHKHDSLSAAIEHGEGRYNDLYAEFERVKLELARAKERTSKDIAEQLARADDECAQLRASTELYVENMQQEAREKLERERAELQEEFDALAHKECDRIARMEQELQATLKKQPELIQNKVAFELGRRDNELAAAIRTKSAELREIEQQLKQVEEVSRRTEQQLATTTDLVSRMQVTLEAKGALANAAAREYRRVVDETQQKSDLLAETHKELVETQRKLFHDYETLKALETKIKEAKEEDLRLSTLFKSQREKIIKAFEAYASMQQHMRELEEEERPRIEQELSKMEAALSAGRAEIADLPERRAELRAIKEDLERQREVIQRAGALARGLEIMKGKLEAEVAILQKEETRLKSLKEAQSNGLG